jgi:hypothetical protein
MTFQWRSNGVDLAGATGATFTLPNVQPVHDAQYSVRVTDARGSIFSAPARLTVYTAPLFSVQPSSRSVVQGNNFTNVASAFSSTPVRYQWFFNEQSLPGATNASLVLTNVQSGQAGVYFVVASDNYGSRTSAVATLTVLVRATLTQHPTPTNSVLAVGETLTLTADATGTEPLLCRWRRLGSSNVAINIGLTLTLTNLQLLEAGYYDIVVTNLAGAASPSVSTRAYVTVVNPPLSRGALSGGDATFRAVLRSAGPSTNRFWWLHNGTVVREGTNTAPSTAAVSFTNDLTLTGLTADQAGQYTFLVSNVVVVSSSLHAATRAFNATLVLDDTTPPTITCPNSLAANADPGLCTANPAINPVASDNVGVAGVACVPAGPYPAGPTLVTCWAWDVSGNSNSCSFTVTVADAQAPVLSGCPDPVTVSVGAGGQVSVPDFLAGVTATDNCGGLSLTQTPLAGTMVGGGTHLVTITARDTVGNATSCQTSLIVEGGETEIQLTIELQGTNAIIRWPDVGGTWVLEETADLTPPPSWSASSATPVQVNGIWQAVVPVAPGASKFFQLRKP